MKVKKQEVLVLSQDCTHHLPDEGLTLEGGQVTCIPGRFLTRVLELPGVIQVQPAEDPGELTTEPLSPVEE